MLNSLIDDSRAGTGTASSRDDGLEDLDQRDTHLATLEQRYRTQVGTLDTLKRRMTATSAFLTQQLARLQQVKKGTGGRTMNARVGRALKVDGRTQVATGVVATTPPGLMVLLHGGAVKAAARAKTALAQDDGRARSAAICKAISIIEQGLRPALSVNGGGDIAADLLALYGYIVNRLLYANLRKHAASLDEVVHLLEELREGWEALERSSRAVKKEQLLQRARGIALSHDRV
jgi:flagellar secretion chaperone FliS